VSENPQERQKSSTTIQNLWTTLKSMKFAIIMLVVIAVVSLLSMFVVEFYPMRAGFSGWEEFYKERYGMGDGVFALFKYFQLYDPYRSWWYLFLLGLLALSLFACLWNMVPDTFRRAFTPRFRLEPKDLKVLPNYQTCIGSFDQQKLTRSLKKRYRLYSKDLENGAAYYGCSGRIQLFGPLCIHLGLLLLVIGGLSISLFGSTYSISGYAGDLLDVPGTDFQVRIDDFRIEYYPLNAGQIVLMEGQSLGRIERKLSDSLFAVNRMTRDGIWITDTLPSSDLQNQFDLNRDRGNIKDYICDLTVIESGEEVHSFSVEVNHPLRYKRIRFYQTSYDADNPKITASFDSVALEVTRVSDMAVLDTLWLKPGQSSPIPYQGMTVSAESFQPDFRITEQGVMSQSAHMHNPAVKMVFSEHDSIRFHQWSFLNRDFHTAREDFPLKLQFVDIRNPMSEMAVRTILQVRISPGTDIIWAGFIFATLGLIIAFYFSFNRLWALVIIRDDKSADYHFAMRNQRGSSVGQHRYLHLIEELKTKNND
jgi:cytochrome c biogenesis protein